MLTATPCRSAVLHPPCFSTSSMKGSRFLAWLLPPASSFSPMISGPLDNATEHTSVAVSICNIVGFISFIAIHRSFIVFHRIIPSSHHLLISSSFSSPYWLFPFPYSLINQLMRLQPYPALRQFVRFSIGTYPVGKEHENQLLFRITPNYCSSKSLMSKCL